VFRSLSPSRLHWLTLFLFVALAILHTWPLATAPGRLGRNGQADTQLNTWAMAWVAHQVIRDPVHLFDANIFYPERHTLAFSEHLFVQAMMGAPLHWAGGSPVLVYNVVFLAGMALTGWTLALVMHRWTGSWIAGVLSGSLIAFNAMTLTRFPHIQLQHLEFFPLALLALDRLLGAPRTKHALQLAGWYVLQSLTSLYFLVFTAIALLASILARPREGVGSRGRAVLPKLLLSAIVAGVALLPFLLPYLYARREQVTFGRTLGDVAQFSARWTDYLATGGTLHNTTWSGQFFRGDGLFPGVVGISLTAIAIASGVAFSDQRARMALVFGVVCFCLSFGPMFPGYSFLYHAFPAMAGVRGAVRFGQMVLVAVAILAGFGLVVLQRRVPASLAVPLGIALVITAHVEALRAPLDFGSGHEFRGVPPIFKTLDTPEPHVVVIFPFYSPRAIFMNARYMVVSTAFWKPMLNGYSGYMPTRYVEHSENLAEFPDRRSVDYLQKLGVTRVLVDSRNMTQRSLAELVHFSELRLIDTDGNLRIYALAER
jgi:hypothetical protein